MGALLKIATEKKCYHLNTQTHNYNVQPWCLLPKCSQIKNQILRYQYLRQNCIALFEFEFTGMNGDKQRFKAILAQIAGQSDLKNLVYPWLSLVQRLSKRVVEIGEGIVRMQ